MADEKVRYELAGGYAIITVDNPPVNAMSAAVVAAIDAAFARAIEDGAVRGIVFTGASMVFIAGADIREFETIADAAASIERSRAIHARMRRIEDSPKPVIAAIPGPALGGGFEYAMACHYRVAFESARIGQPEVQLGILPGAGGTQRLPRLCSIGLAVEMCTMGVHLPARRAFDEGLIDAIADGDLIVDAMRFLDEHPAPRRTRDRAVRREGADAAFAAARESLARTARGARAPYRNIEALEAALAFDFDAGCEREIELFAECVTSHESRALVKLFFAEREAAKAPGVTRDTPAAEIRHVAVIGAGTMGSGIAMAYANAGIPVLLKETTPDALDRGMAAMRRNWEASAAKGRITRAEVERRLGLIQPVLTYAGFGEVDLVVEAAFEDFELKKQLFSDLGRVTKPGAFLVSNTSTLDIDEFARASGRPERVAGHHFFSPANVMKLIEIVRGEATSPETLATSVKLAKRLGKAPVVVGNCFGFVANRMLAYYLREAHLMLEEGASVAQIDRVMTAFGFPVGPFAMQDIAGLDVGGRIRAYLRSIGRTRADGPQSPVPDRLYEMGRFGQKTGAGWYRYEAGSRVPVDDPLIESMAAEAARERGVERRAIEDGEVLTRILTALANEGASILDEGIATRPGDIDVIYTYGFGFPRHRGGPMLWADQVGLAQVLANVREFSARLGSHWKASPLLEHLAMRGRSFYR